MKTPLVTVLTTTYNHSRFIADCIRSVLAQTYDNWEQVIVDDGSTDRTEEIVNEFDDERIVYVRQKHVGIHRLSETYNRGLKLAKGDFIAILEGDDMYPKRKLELQIDSLADGTILSFGKYAIVDANQNHKYLGYYPLNTKKYIGKVDWLRNLLVSTDIVSNTVMIRKDALDKIGGFIQPSGSKFVDYSTYLELTLIGNFKFIDEILGIWVKHGDNWSDKDLDNYVFDNYGIAFCRKHSIPVDWKIIREKIGRDLFHIARHQLLDGNKEKAIKTFEQAFMMSSISGKIKSLGGISASIIGLDLEKIAGSLGRPTER